MSGQVPCLPLKGMVQTVHPRYIGKKTEDTQLLEGKLGILTHQNNTVSTKLEDKAYTSTKITCFIVMPSLKYC